MSAKEFDSTPAYSVYPAAVQCVHLLILSSFWTVDSSSTGPELPHLCVFRCYRQQALNSPYRITKG